MGDKVSIDNQSETLDSQVPFKLLKTATGEEREALLDQYINLRSKELLKNALESDNFGGTNEQIFQGIKNSVADLRNYPIVGVDILSSDEIELVIEKILVIVASELGVE